MPLIQTLNTNRPGGSRERSLKLASPTAGLLGELFSGRMVQDQLYLKDLFVTSPSKTAILLGKIHFWLISISLNFTLVPLFFLGLEENPWHDYSYLPGMAWDGHQNTQTDPLSLAPRSLKR